jgi:exportin-5
MSYVAGFLEEKGLNLQSAYAIDIPLFLQFLIEILRHQSLTVSIPVLHSWSRLLVSERIGNMDAVTRLIAPLLEICTQRLVRWESLPEDSDDPTVLFLNEDIDTTPERHAFVGNYRRYCSSVIEIIVQKRPHDAIPHILSGVDQILNNLYSGVQPFSGMVTHTRIISLSLVFNMLEQLNPSENLQSPSCAPTRNSLWLRRP